MTKENLTIRLLTEMRKSMEDMNERLAETRDEMRSEFANVHQDLDEARTERSALRQRIAEGEMRTATELLSVSGSLDEIKALIRQQSAVKLVVTDHERRIRKLEGD